MITKMMDVISFVIVFVLKVMSLEHGVAFQSRKKRRFFGDKKRRTKINGSHNLLLLNFVGITTWIGRFSITPLKIIPKSLNGVARLAYWTEI